MVLIVLDFYWLNILRVLLKTVEKKKMQNSYVCVYIKLPSLYIFLGILCTIFGAFYLFIGALETFENILREMGA